MDEQANESNQPELNETQNQLDDDDLLGLDEFFDGLEPNMTLVISRLEPSEFKGVLEEIDIADASNPISLNYLINKWGGHKLLLRLRRKRGQKNAGQWVQHRVVNLYTYPPMRFGKPLKRSIDFNGSNFEDEPPRPSQNKQDNSMEAMLGVAQMMQQMRSSELQNLASLMGSLAPQRVDNPQPTTDPISQASKMLGLMSQFQALQHPAQPTGESDEVIGLLGTLAKTFVETQKTPSHGAPSLVAREPTSNPQNPQPKMLPTPQSIIDGLRNDFVRLPAQQRGEALQLLFGQLQAVGGDEAILQAVSNLGIIDLDDDATDSEENQDTGREHGPNEGNDSFDRGVD